jgi:hypothetical protein
LEATGNSDAIATLLAPLVGRVVVSNPVKTRAIAQAKVKTDKVDARILAQLLAADFLPPGWLPDERTRSLRRQVHRRAHLVRLAGSVGVGDRWVPYGGRCPPYVRGGGRQSRKGHRQFVSGDRGRRKVEDTEGLGGTPCCTSPRAPESSRGTRRTPPPR